MSHYHAIFTDVLLSRLRPSFRPFEENADRRLLVTEPRQTRRRVMLEKA